jgi:hypothetical protein
VTLSLKNRFVIAISLTTPYLILLTAIYFLKRNELATELALLTSGLTAILFTFLTGLILFFNLKIFQFNNLTFILKKILIILLIIGTATLFLVNFYPVNLILFLVLASYFLSKYIDPWISAPIEEVRLEPVAFLAVGFKVLIFVLLIF